MLYQNFKKNEISSSLNYISQKWFKSIYNKKNGGNTCNACGTFTLNNLRWPLI